VIVSDDPIEFPRVITPDILVSQAQDSIDRFGDVLKPDGTLIIDSDMVHEYPKNVKHIYKVAATTIARNEIEMSIVANMVMLGALSEVTKVVSKRAIEKAICGSVPSNKKQINLEAFKLGAERVIAE